MLIDHDQEKLLEEATIVVKEQAFYMKRSIDNENLRDSLKHASNMICELRTSLLSPKNYYELYMQVFQELQYLARFFGDKTRHHRKMSELYETVQHAGNIVPRLYLVITVGAMYMKSKEAPARDILYDMTELCKGVQHPIRGLFLRYYLSQMCKDKLPDSGSEYEMSGGGDLNDAFDFLLTNFVESSGLWVRLQHQGTSRDKQKREKERHDLRVLVGSNLVRMSQLEGMSSVFYAETALPKLVDQIVGCKDTMAQQYLLDCVIQVFSDECHLITLSPLLKACLSVQSEVDLKPVLVNLMTRLSHFVLQNPNAVPEGVNIYKLFRDNLNELFERSSQKIANNNNNNNDNTSSPLDTIKACTGDVIDLVTLLELQVAFLSFTISLYPNETNHVDAILQSSINILSKNIPLDEENKQIMAGPGIASIVDLLSLPLKTMSLSILQLENYTTLMGFLNMQTKKNVAISLVNAVLINQTPLDDVDAVGKLFLFITPLIKTEKAIEDEEFTHNFIREQQQLGRLIHSIQNPDTDVIFTMYLAARDLLLPGGPKRIVYSLPSLIINALQLVSRILTRETTPKHSIKKVIQFVHQCCTELISCDAEVAIRMFLQGAIVVSQVAQSLVTPINSGFEPICNEFLTQALVAYEEELSDSRSQSQAIIMLVGTLSSHISCLEPENYDNLSSKITQHGAKLLKKPDQCKAVLLCSHLFWNNTAYRDPNRVLECLKKCLKIADIAVVSSSSHIYLFTHILDEYIYYFEQGNTSITVAFIQNLISLCIEHLRYPDSSTSSQDAKKAFNNTLNYIQHKKHSEPNSIFASLETESAREALEASS